MPARGPGRVVPRVIVDTVTSGVTETKTNVTSSSEALLRSISELTHADGEDSKRWRWRSGVPAVPPRTLHGAAAALDSGKNLNTIDFDQPLLLTGAGLCHCRLVHGGTPHQASKVVSAAQGGGNALRLLCSQAGVNRFVDFEESKNIPGSYYHVRVPQTRALSMSFDAWLGSWRSWQTSRLLLQVDVCAWELQHHEDVAELVAGQQLSQSLQLPRVSLRPETNSSMWMHLPKLLEWSGDAGALLDWRRVAVLLDAGRYSRAGRLRVLAGGRSALLPARYAPQDRLLLQVAGRCHVALLPPHAAFQGAYPFPVSHPHDTYSCVDWEAGPDPVSWPGSEQVQT